MYRKRTRLCILIFIYFIILLFVICKSVIVLINKSAITSFKKLYSTYMQALEATVFEMAGDTGCYFSADKNIQNDFSDCEKFYKNFATNLKVSKYCNGNALKDGCVPIYKNYITTSVCAGFSENMMNKYNQVFVMDDNTNLIVFNQPANVQKPLFAVDSNGKLMPNKSGFDLFSLVIMRKANGSYYFHPNVIYCLPYENGGIHNLQDVYK